MLIETFLIIEFVLIAILGVMWIISTLIRRGGEEDPVCVFCSTFWREFPWPPITLSSVDSATAVTRSSSRPPAPRPKVKIEEASEEDAFYGRVRKGADGKNLKSELAVLVIPHAANDSVVGRDGDGIRIQVSGDVADSQSNKSMIELIANALGLKPYQVTLTKGHYQPKKNVQIQGLSPEELRAKLGELVEAE